MAVTAAATVTSVAWADLTIGVSVQLTGPASGLGITVAHGVKIWPATIGGEKINVVALSDITDPTKGIQNSRRFFNEDKG